MKKLLLIVAVITAFSFVSCKKDRVCTCTYTIGGATSTDITTYTKSMKGDARERCMSETGTSGGQAYTLSCTLK